MILLFAALARAASPCVDCHPSQAASHAESRHADAFDNPTFRRAWAAFPQRWCLSCHAPEPEDRTALGVAEGPPGALVRAPARALPDDLGRGTSGVTCTTCHLDADGTVRSATPPSELAVSQHAIRHDPGLGDTACATCHQFRGPTHERADPFLMDGPVLQDTAAEWQASAHAATPCSACHMPGGDHRTPGGHDAAFVRAAVDVLARRTSPATIAVDLIAVDVGHALPTGDPFRRLVVELCATPSCSLVLDRATLGRTLEGHDARVPAASGRRTLALAAEGPLPPSAAWRVRLHLADPNQQADLPVGEAFVDVASGLVP